MASDEAWDAVTIGSGLGALTAAAILAKAGRRVLVLERLSNFGGAATIYRHGSLTMEASLHETDGATVKAPHGLFAQLGLQHKLQPIEIDEFYEVRGGPLSSPVRVPHGLDEAESALVEARPSSAVGIKAFFRGARRLHNTLADMEDAGTKGPMSLLSTVFSGRIFELLGHLRETVSEHYDDVLGDDEAAKLIIAALLPYFDDDPSRLSHTAYTGIWSRYAEDGSYYFKGGSRALTFALLKMVKDAGGTARRLCEVEAVLMDGNGSMSGVRYVDEAGEQITCRAPVVFAGNAPEHLANLLPSDVSGALKAKYEAHEPSISLFNISLGLNSSAESLGITSYSTFIYPKDLERLADYPEVCARFGQEPGAQLPPYVIADYGRLDSGLRQPGDLHLVSICGVDRFVWWKELDETEEMARRGAWMDRLIADVNRLYPGFDDAVVQKEIATSRTMKNRLGTPGGEVYGFRPTPERMFSRPPKAATPVKGLFLSSAYTVSGGYAGAMHGGLMAGEAARKYLR